MFSKVGVLCGATIAALCLAAPANVNAAEAAKNTKIDRLDQPALILTRPIAAELQAVIKNGDRLLAVGQRGVIIYSDDEGESWTQAKTPVSVALTSITARPDGVAVAVGHDAAILRSDDNGATWSKIVDGRTLLPERISVLEAEFKKAKAVFEAYQAKQEAAGGDGAAEDAAGDGGAEAPEETVAEIDGQPVLDEFQLEDLDFRVDTMKQSMEFGPAWPFLDVLFLSKDPKENRMLALGAFGTAYLSDDAGKSWKLISHRFDNPSDLHLNNGFVTKTGAILIGSEQGNIFRAEADAASFKKIFQSTDEFSFFDMNIVPGSDTIVAYGFGDTYHFSTDDGLSWSSSRLSESMSLAGNVVLPTGGLGLMGDGGQMFEIGPDGEKRRFRPIDTRKMLGDAVPISKSRVLFVSELGVTIADKL